MLCVAKRNLLMIAVELGDSSKFVRNLRVQGAFAGISVSLKYRDVLPVNRHCLESSLDRLSLGPGSHFPSRRAEW